MPAELQTNPENDKYSLVDFAIDDNPSGFQDALDQQIKDVIADKLADRKLELQKSVLDVGYDNVPDDSENAEPDSDDQLPSDGSEDDNPVDDQLSDDEIGDIPEEEWAAIIKQIEDGIENGDVED